MTDALESRWLPDGRFELTLGKCIPVIVSASVYFSKTGDELLRLVGEMTLFAYALAHKHGYDLPRYQRDRFVETGPGKYALEEVPAPGGPATGAAA